MRWLVERQNSGIILKKILKRKTKSTSSRMMRVINRPNWRMPRSNSVSGGRVARRAAMAPKAVCAAGRHDQRGGHPRLHRRAEKDAVIRLVDDVMVARQVMGLFLHRQRFPGERRLAHLQIFFLQQAAIRGDQIAGVEW